MKKVIMIIAAVVMTGVIMAQESDVLKSKNGMPILPKAGDIGVGIDATPFIDLAGNLISINTGAAFSTPAALVSFTNGTPQLFFKYYSTSKQAYRIGIRAAKFKTVTNTDVPSVADPLVNVTNKSVSNYGLINLTAGIENHKGVGRVQGIYGAEAIINLGNGSVLSQNVKNTFADPLSATNTGTRTLSTKAGMSIGLGARGFVGAEVFVAPKVCIGGQVGWSALYTTQLDSKTKTESFATGALVETETSSSNGGSFTIDGDTMGGCLYLGFAEKVGLTNY